MAGCTCTPHMHMHMHAGPHGRAHLHIVAGVVEAGAERFEPKVGADGSDVKAARVRDDVHRDPMERQRRDLLDRVLVR